MTNRAAERQTWDQPDNACEVLMLAGDAELAMLHVLARAEARVVTAKISGLGVEEAEVAREAAYVTAAIVFGGRQ